MPPPAAVLNRISNWPAPVTVTVLPGTSVTERPQQTPNSSAPMSGAARGPPSTSSVTGRFGSAERFAPAEPQSASDVLTMWRSSAPAVVFLK